MILSPGQRVEARCTRCRDVTGHVVVALADGRVVKVQCCACGSTHRYYPPPRPPALPGAERPLRVRSGEERTEAAREQRKPEPREKPGTGRQSREKQQEARLRAEMERQWRDALARTPAVPLPYAMDGRFPLGGLVSHPVFGVGMVLALTPPDKMEILFREGVKALRCQC
jgi:hypothetical protein